MDLLLLDRGVSANVLRRSHDLLASPAGLFLGAGNRDTREGYKRMRGLFVDQYSEWGGAQFMLRDTMVEALRRGWHIEFSAPGNGGLFEFCKARSIPSHHLDFGVYTSGGKNLSDVLRYPRDIACATRQIRAV